MSTKLYLNFIRKAVKTEGYHTADIANKMALDIEAITLDQYRAAARIIADAYMETRKD